MGQILQFKSCAVGGEYNGFVTTPSTYHYIGIAAPANIQNQINENYLGTTLDGKVTGIGYGWQQYIVPSSGKAIFTVRGAAGGISANSNFSINPNSGAVTGSGNRSGRGAKLVGEMKLKKEDILYILVGMRGYCPSVGSNWGAGGGGATIVLKDNPSGTYTFAPLNRKVDVLFVAGGGGGARYLAGNAGSSYYGKDATITNGSTTNGGSASSSAGGAGLTGNGGQGSQGSVARNLLSGTPTVTSLNSANYGGWGGGASGWYGGGGGGGYSGGAGVDTIGGYGGTSYINPNLCLEIFRGYATVEEDSTRNCSNPWTAYGFVEIDLGRSDTKYILAKDSEGYKYFDGTSTIYGTSISSASNTWKLLPNSDNKPTDDIFTLYGTRLITNIDGLVNNNVEILVSSSNPEEVILIDGKVANTIVKMKNDANLADISSFKSITFTNNLTGTTIKFAVSKDYGKTWQTYESGVWTDIDISDTELFKSTGYDLSFFSSIPLSDWQLYNAKTLRFAFCITQNTDTDNTPILSLIECIADLVGSWGHFTESQASYEYITDDTVEITFKQAGNYKVNYLDSIS